MFLVSALQACPEDSLAHFRLANAHFALCEFDKASRLYFEAMKRTESDDPLLVKIHINMGISLESQGLLTAAEREYSKAAKMAPNHPRVFKLLGSARYAAGDLQGALTSLEHSLKCVD